MSNIYIRERNGKFSFTISMGIDKSTGERRRREFGGFLTKAEAQKAYALKMAEYLKEGEIFTPSNVCIGTIWEEYIQQAKLTVKTSTIQRQTSIFNNHISKFSTVPIKDITPKALADMQLALLPTHKPSYIRTILMVWNNLFRYALDNNYLRHNPLSKTSKVKAKREETRIPNENELQEIEKVLLPTQLLPYRLAKGLGLRAGEVLGLRWSDFNFTKGTVKISRQLLVDSKNSSFTIGELKTKNSYRTLFLSDGLSSYLQQILNEQRTNQECVKGYIRSHTLYSSISQKTIEIDDFVCVRSNGRFLRHNNITHLSRMIHRLLGYDWFHFHSLRHYWASFLLRQHVSIATVSKLMGHADINTTLLIYSHSMPSETDDVKSALSKIMM